MPNLQIITSWPIRRKLFLVLMFLFLPASGIIISSSLYHREHEMESAKKSALMLVQSFAAQQEQIDTGTKLMLSTLAYLPQVRNLDTKTSNELFCELNNRYPFYTNISAATPEGKMFASSVPFNLSVNLSDRKHIQDVIRTIDFSAGEYIVGRVSKVPSINYTYPVLDADNNLIAIVIAGFNLDEYAHFLNNINFRESSVLTITDHKATRLYRYPGNDTSAPNQPVPADIIEQITGNREQGIFERIGQDGIDRIYAFKQLRLRDNSPPYLYIIVDIAKASIFHKANLEMAINLSILGVAVSVAMLLSWIIGHYFLVRPINQLVTTTQRLGSGQLEARTGLAYTPDELGLLAQSFDNMALMLEKRNIEREKAEEALRESEERYRTVANFTYDWEYWINPERCFIYCSPSCERITGYRAEEFEKDPDLLKAITHPDDRDQFVYHTDGAASPGPESHEQEVRIFSRSGEVRWIAHACRIVRDNDGTFRGRRASNRDITSRKQAEEEKAQLEGQLWRAQKMESIGSLAGGIAHDLNNILFPISGLSEMLLDDIPPDTPEHKSIEQIHKSAKRGSDLVKQILSFSRQSNPQKLPILIQPILNEALKLAQATIPRNIEIKSHINTDCGMISADPTQIHQIAMNLITNAFHAVEQTGGMIDIALKEIAISSFNEKDELPFHAIPGDILAGGYACIIVSDTGTGIDQTLIDKIFDPFFTTKEIGKGTGLGLSVVHGIVKEHGGDIRVYSEVGKGTIFHVYLPLLEDAKDKKVAAVTRKYPTGRERILLVDDEEPIVRMEQMMLERLGYQVTIRMSSPDALAAFKANPGNFDLVISDRGMPNMTGDQLARELISIRPEIPVIICTGFCDENDEKCSMDLGIKGFLKKPVATGDLAEMVRKVLDEVADSILANESGQTDAITPVQKQLKDQDNG